MSQWLRISAFVAAVVAVRTLWAGWLGLAEDEAYYWVWSQRLAAGYFDHPPAIAWVIRAGTALLGDTERGVRLGGILLGGAAALLAAPVGRDRGLVVAALATMPLFALGGLLATPDVPLVAAWCGALLAASRGRWAWVGLCCGLAMLSKYTGVLLLPGIVLAAPGALRTRGPWVAAVVAAAVYSPNILWNLEYDNLSWAFQLHHVASEADRLGFLAAQVGLAGGLLFVPMAVFWARGWRGDAVDRLCWWTSAPLLAVAVWAGGEANWAAPALVSGVVGAARLGGRWPRVAWGGVGMAGLLSAFVLVHAIHPLVDLPVDPTDRLEGGRVLGESVGAWGVPVVLTSRYQEAALIHFYGHVAAHKLPGQGRMDQYDLWAPPGDPDPPDPHSLPDIAEDFPPLPDAGLFVRPWRGSATVAIEELGYDRGGPHTVTAKVNPTDPLGARPIARWQVFEFWRPTLDDADGDGQGADATGASTPPPAPEL